jgi:hypothetical protein
LGNGARTGRGGSRGSGWSSSGGRRSRGRSLAGRSSSRLRLLFHGINVVVDLLGVLVVAEDISLNGLGGIVSLILRLQGSLGHDTKGVGRTNFHNSLSGPLTEEHILGLNPSNGRSKLVCEQLNEQRVSELLLDFGTHFGGIRS